MMRIDEYNAQLRAQDAARAIRRPQPRGLAGWQARRAAEEADALKPYAVVKDGYEYAVTFEGRGSSVNRFRTKRDALETVQALRARWDANRRLDEYEAARDADPQAALTPDEFEAIIRGMYTIAGV